MVGTIQIPAKLNYLKNPVISNESQNIAAKYIRYSKETQSGKALGFS
jgi:hypothetical protein